MSETGPHDPAPLAARTRLRAFGVHVFTALGGALALMAMLEAVRAHWAAVFGWLGLALVVDGLDGPLARRLNVGAVLPNWSGDTLDLVVDFLTYVFVPAYAITASGLLPPVLAPLIGAAIVVSGALYFADRRMKTDDHHFRGFPALWNALAFYLFLLKPQPWLATLALAAFVALTFVPFRVMHPLRTARFRTFNIALIAAWAVLAIVAIAANFDVPPWITAGLCAIGGYILFSDVMIRLIGRTRA